MKNFISKTLALLVLFGIATTAFAETIAILEATIIDPPEGEEENQVEFTVEETRYLTDELRKVAVETLPAYSILSREQILSLIPPTQGDLSSVIDIGMVIKSEYITRGTIKKMGSLFTLKVELYECKNKQLINEFTTEAPDFKGLVDGIRANASKLFKKLAPEETKPEMKVTVEVIPTNINQEPKTKLPIWVGIGLDVLGAAGIGFGIYKYLQANDYYDDYKNMPPNGYLGNESKYNKAYKKVTDANTLKNISLIAGGVFFVSGLTVHIWF